MPNARSIRHALKKADLFRFTPHPRAENREQVSLRGLIGTAIALGIMLLYAVFTSQRFLAGSPTISTAQDIMSNEAFALPETAIIFRRNDEQMVPRILFFNESFFTYSMSLSDVSAQDLYPRVTTDLNVTECNVSSWAGWLGGVAFCPGVSSVKIQGRYQSPNYTFFRIDVFLCDPQAPPRISKFTGKPVFCAPQQEIDDVVTNGRFNLLLHQPATDSSPETWDAEMYLVNPAEWDQYEGIYQKHTVITNPNFFSSFSEKRYTYLALVKEKFNQRHQRAAPLGKYVLTLFSRLDGLQVVEQRSVQTLPDLVGQWAAFFSVISGGLAIYFLRYNREKFYAANPQWDNFTKDFVSVEKGKDVPLQPVSVKSSSDKEEQLLQLS